MGLGCLHRRRGCQLRLHLILGYFDHPEVSWIDTKGRCGEIINHQLLEGAVFLCKCSNVGQQCKVLTTGKSKVYWFTSEDTVHSHTRQILSAGKSIESHVVFEITTSEPHWVESLVLGLIFH